MTDDIVTRLRGQACPECGLPSTHNQFDEAADEIERLRAEYELTYWNIRRALETARDDLESPHPLWGALNECFEDVDRMEKTLDIANRMEPF